MRAASESRVLESAEVEEPGDIPAVFGLETDFEPEEGFSVEGLADQHLAALAAHDSKDYVQAFRHFSNVNSAVHQRPRVEPIDAAAMRTLAFLSHDVAEDGREQVFTEGNLEGEQLFENYDGNAWELAKYFTGKEGEYLAAGADEADRDPLAREYAGAENDFYRIHGEINEEELTGEELEDRERDMWYAIRRSVELRFPGAGGGSVNKATEHYFDAVREGHDAGNPEAAARHLTQFYDTLV